MSDIVWVCRECLDGGEIVELVARQDGDVTYFDCPRCEVPRGFFINGGTVAREDVERWEFIVPDHPPTDWT